MTPGFQKIDGRTDLLPECLGRIHIQVFVIFVWQYESRCLGCYSFGQLI